MKTPFLFKPVVSKTSPFISPAQISELLKCAKNVNHAAQIHAQLITQEYIRLPLLFNSLLNIYSKCGHVLQSLSLFTASNSREGFDGAKNVFIYTSLITQLSHWNLHLKAISFFNEMRERGIFPNHFTFSAVLPACGDLALGKQMHSLIFKHGIETDVFVSSALADMYAKSGEMIGARKVFDEMPHRNLVSWNSMIVGSLRNGIFNEAIEFFTRMINEDAVVPDQVSFSSVLSACANVCGLAFGRQVHGRIFKHGLDKLLYVKNSLMDMYCKCGSFDDAEKLFVITEERDVVTWNIMMTEFVQNGNLEDACNCFWAMRRESVVPDAQSYSTVLHAAAGIGMLDQGTLIHNQIIKSGLGGNLYVSSSLITMYGKCGSLVDARRAFSENHEHNVISWTSMISACQQHGCANEVIELFEDMLRASVEPDYITFVSVLSACGHTGRVNDGFSYFNLMSQRFKIDPGLEHYACMVDMLGRADCLHDAKRFVETMPIEPDISVWGALLGACRKYGNLELGRKVAERLFQMEPDNPGNYVLLYNMYVRGGKLEEANEVRRLMGFRRVRKEPGCSWIDVKNTTHVFKARDRSHSMTNEIYKMLEKLEELVKQKGYVPKLQRSSNDLDEDEEKNLWYHSERLALAFGLLIVPVGAPIRIKKNLRTCDDCHVVMKYASAIYKRDIIIRDINRFHHFADGSCSCGEYW
ncbi:pentatricopeptide repeat-containing protein At2g22070-like [Andrographis paniculata]|uniref:pentatricopeptide repeat-containing protein At2g22070-like n=1 Tax=Andrographis paniculata TaxID=175694 RepID=UPI0021E704F3|nr:pentatricopeptide repeat-containing protein At2g22070-like [Andrographis paniculata]XP_051132640.1 pentatricopeptide repeat-containing protein At2g22070-like [Andrographis paniculata]XP_051132645.1 pentatricopeptide repeat-containing protein At2g22070-like [Andrographis paniculata]